MKRILLVDGDPAALRLLQQELAVLREACDLSFVAGAAEALALLEQSTYDVVLTDIHLGGMGGLELLAEVKRRYPQVVRLAYSGCAHQDLVVRGLAVAHQVLPKPLSAELVWGTVSRACALRDQLGSAALLTLVSGLHRLPSLPSVYEELVTVARDDSSTIDQAARIIVKDAGLAAHLLHIVNSVFFNLRRTVVSPAHAVALLGLETVSALVLSASVHQTLQTAESDRATVASLQRHGLAVAQSARQFVSMEEVGRLALDQAFTAGLLHDLGRLVLEVQMPDECLTVRQLMEVERMVEIEAERVVLHATHAQVGGYVLALWGLGAAVVEAVVFHHEPRSAHRREFSVLTAVHVADGCAQAERSGMESGKVDHEYLAEIGFADRFAQWKAAV